ncbi:MAG: MBOAT family O-acyltransferase [Actinomycetes bacterium]
MIFPTVQFAAFFAVVLPVSWLLMPRLALWKPFVLAASYVFYGAADWRFCLLLGASTVGNQLAAVRAEAARTRGDEAARRRWVTAAVALDLGLLGVFKYLGFFVDSVDSLLRGIGLAAPLPLLHIALPVGISFFTFQAMSYVIDVGRGRADVASIADFAIYQAFFPHLVAGPIVRAREFLPQLRTPRNPRDVPATAALFLILGGLVKKVVFADLLATRLVDPVFEAPGAHSAPEVLLAIYGYAGQIYCDFSAYTDIAIGVALLLGFRFPQNFDRPYAALSLQDFWRRWHMTLSRWLRDYLYISLGGNRRGRARTYVNLALTLVLGGLWHGASWTFVIWGALHGGGLAVERWISERRRPSAPPSSAEPSGPEPSGPEPSGLKPSSAEPSGAEASGTGRPTLGAAGTLLRSVRIPRQRPPADARAPAPATDSGVRAPGVALRWALTFHVVCLAWVFFRAPDLGSALQLLGRLAHPGPAPLVSVGIVLTVAAALGSQFVPARVWEVPQQWFARLPLVWQGVALAGVVLVVNAVVGEQGVAPFIYFRF